MQPCVSTKILCDFAYADTGVLPMSLSRNRLRSMKKVSASGEVQFNAYVPAELDVLVEAFLAEDETLDKKKHTAAMLFHYTQTATDDDRDKMFAAYRRWKKTLKTSEAFKNERIDGDEEPAVNKPPSRRRKGRE